jgi:hypothetical protein
VTTTTTSWCPSRLRSRLSRLLLEHLADTEIDNLQHIFLVGEAVVRLDNAVDDALVVQLVPLLVPTPVLEVLISPVEKY